MEGNFIKASKLKLRFKSGTGNVSVEDLWDLDLKIVDKIAIALKKELGENETDSFIKPKTSDKTTELRFDIAKYIIETRLAEQEAAKVRAEKAAKRAQIKELMAKKQLDSLESKSLEDLQKELDALEA